MPSTGPFRPRKTVLVAQRELRLHYGYYSFDPHHLTRDWGVAGLAVQQQMGLLPFRRARPDLPDCFSSGRIQVRLI